MRPNNHHHHHHLLSLSLSLSLIMLSGVVVAAATSRPSMMACFNVPSWHAGTERPLCGNGRLDPGEVCDDGNRNDGDGCASFCSHFDAMPAAATLAGATTPCPTGDSPVLVSKRQGCCY